MQNLKTQCTENRQTFRTLGEIPAPFKSSKYPIHFKERRVSDSPLVGEREIQQYRAGSMSTGIAQWSKKGAKGSGRRTGFLLTSEQLWPGRFLPRAGVGARACLSTGQRAAK